MIGQQQLKMSPQRHLAVWRDYSLKLEERGGHGVSFGVHMPVYKQISSIAVLLYYYYYYYIMA